MTSIYTMTGAEVVGVLKSFGYTLNQIAELAGRPRATVACASLGKGVREDTAQAFRTAFKRAVARQKQKLAKMEGFLPEADNA